MFKKRKYSEDDKKKWLKVIIPEMMSSEDSEDDDRNHVKTLSWRAPIVTDFFNDLDQEFSSNKSSQAKRQTKVREIAPIPSSRPAPANMPSWAIV